MNGTNKHSRKKKKFLYYLNPKNLSTEINRCGFHFSWSNYLKYLLLVYVSIAVFAYFFGLKWPFVLTIMVLTTLFMPSVFFTAYRYMYEQKKFDDLTNYMEQLIYSFKRRNKILTSLTDTLTLFPEGEMHDALKKAIEYIQTSNTEGNIFAEALAFIEEGYGCKRLYTLHAFLINIESTGGEFDDALDILLKDRKLWVDRTYELERDKKNVKVKVTVGIMLSFVICLMAVFMLPSNFGIINNIASQSITTFVFICNLFIWYIANKKLSGSLIETGEDVPFKSIQRRYEMVFHGNLKKKKRTFFIAGLILIPLVVYFYFKLGMSVAIIGSILIYLIITQPARQYKFAFKQIQKEVEKAFPDWLMSMSLLLQTDNVHVSLSKSIDEAPEILREELLKLEDGIEQYPNDVGPYVHFMKKMDIPDILSAMKMLYSMAEYGAKDISKQIGSLVERNSTMTDKAERLRAEDYLAGMGFLVLLPMLTGVFKLLTDMALVMFYILSIVNTI